MFKVISLSVIVLAILVLSNPHIEIIPYYCVFIAAVLAYPLGREIRKQWDKRGGGHNV